MKKYATLLAILAVLIALWFGIRFLLGGDEDTWLCREGAWVRHGNPAAPMPTEPCRSSIFP